MTATSPVFVPVVAGTELTEQAVYQELAERDTNRRPLSPLCSLPLSPSPFTTALAVSYVCVLGHHYLN